MSDRDIYVWGLSLSVFMLLATVVFSSCRKEETDPVVSVGNVRLAYNWDKLPAEIKSGEGMSLRFYGADGQVYDRQSDTVSFSGELPEGTYRVLLRNRPTPGIGFRGDDCYETAEAVLRGLPVSRVGCLLRHWLVAKCLPPGPWSCLLSRGRWFTTLPLV